MGADHSYRIMIEEMAEGAVTLTAEGVILYCNRCFAAMLQAPLEGLLGSAIQDWLAPAPLGLPGAPVGRQAFEELLRQGEAQGSGQCEIQLRTAAGGQLPAYVAVTALSGSSAWWVIRGSACRRSPGGTDLTEQKAAAEAEAANRAKDHFLATLSHELRTPADAGARRGLARSRAMPGCRPTSARQLAMMRRNVELEARLIDDMLDLTRIARGKLELHREAADLRQVLEHALQTMRCRGQPRRTPAARSSSCAAEPATASWADAPRLTQVFWNLLNNAVKFTPAGGTIAVRSRREPGPAATELVVEVTDNGIGIDAGGPAAASSTPSSRASPASPAASADWGWGSPSARRSSSCTAASLTADERRQGPRLDLHGAAAGPRAGSGRPRPAAATPADRAAPERRRPATAPPPPGRGPRRHRRGHGRACCARSATG